MQIHDKTLSGIANTSIERTEASQPPVRGSKGTSRASSSQSDDQVALSSARRYAVEAGRLASTERQDRIDQIQKEFLAGQYRVDAVEVSRAMIRSVMEGPA